MPSIAAIIAVSNDPQSQTALDRLSANKQIANIASAGAPTASPNANIHRLNAQALRSRADVVEALRWFQSTDASHLIWLLSPRVEITASGLNRLAHVAA